MELGEDNVRGHSISPGGIANGIFGKVMGQQAAAVGGRAMRVLFEQGQLPG
jgi:hypothetical protein